jgi:hypothetical protein
MADVQHDLHQSGGAVSGRALTEFPTDPTVGPRCGKRWAYVAATATLANTPRMCHPLIRLAR